MGDLASPFLYSFQRTLYELATCANTSAPNYVSHPEGLTKLVEIAYISFLGKLGGMTLHDNVFFLGKRPSNFLLNVLAHISESNTGRFDSAFWWGTFVAGKRFALQLKGSEDAREYFLILRNHCSYWFTEVTFKLQGNKLYRVYQQGLEVLPLYETISE